MSSRGCSSGPEAIDGNGRLAPGSGHRFGSAGLARGGNAWGAALRSASDSGMAARGRRAVRSDGRERVCGTHAHRIERSTRPARTLVHLVRGVAGCLRPSAAGRSARPTAASAAPATALTDGPADPRFRCMIPHELPNQIDADSAERCAESASIPPACARPGSIQLQPARGRTPIAVTLTSARMSAPRPWNAHDQAEAEGGVAGTWRATAPTRCAHALPGLV